MAARIDWGKIHEITALNLPHLAENLHIAASDEDVSDMYAGLEDLCSTVGYILAEMYDTKTARIIYKAAEEINRSRKNPNPRV